MENNIDEDIAILKELADDTIRYGMVETDAYMAGAITRVLSELEKYKKAYELETYERQKFIDELETWKKIAEKLAEDLSKHIWLNDKEAIIKIYREKVEEDETYS